jgi:hypothetical protein
MFSWPVSGHCAEGASHSASTTAIVIAIHGMRRSCQAATLGAVIIVRPILVVPERQAVAGPISENLDFFLRSRHGAGRRIAILFHDRGFKVPQSHLNGVQHGLRHVLFPTFKSPRETARARLHEVSCIDDRCRHRTSRCNHAPGSFPSSNHLNRRATRFETSPARRHTSARLSGKYTRRTKGESPRVSCLGTECQENSGARMQGANDVPRDAAGLTKTF